MYDVNAFERQVSDEALRMAGPSEPVDDAAIFTAITATQSPKWRFQSMFSATKFLVAGAIVALFGGFLLTGVFNQQSGDDHLPAAGASASASTQAEPTVAATSKPEPTTVVEANDSATGPGLLPGVDLVTEEIAPGVYRVLGDRIDAHVYDGFDEVATGPDGSVWVRRRKRKANDRIWKVGDATSLPRAPRGRINAESYAMAIDADGRLVEAHHDGLSIGRDSEDLSPVFEVAGYEPTAMTLLPDGDIWASWMSERDTVRLGVFDGQGWTEYATPDGVESVIGLGYSASVDDLAATPDGDVWVAIAGNWGAGFGGGALVNFDGETWTEVRPLGGDPLHRISDVHHLTVAPDGSLWALVWLYTDGLTDAERPADFVGSAQALLRFDGRTWEAHPSRQVLSDVDVSQPTHLEGPIVVDDAGRVWASLGGPTQSRHLIVFDGASTTHFEDVKKVNDLAVDENGAVWAAAGGSLFVITSEAMAE
jgi:hypothetical protein